MSVVINKLLANDKIRYVLAGGCTTFVNLITFFILRSFTSVDRNLCNVIAISMAITFAYFANKYFVFRSKTNGLFKTVSEAASFVGARLVSMGVEILGFAILCDSFRISEIFSKLIVQVVVFVLNYVFSNVFVFNRERRSFTEYIKSEYCYYISFFIVAVFMIAVCVSEGIVPFGNNSLTIVDSVHQYLPFLSELRDKLLNEGSLFYTWNIAMGSNFVSLSAYYLNSPFNYLLLLFDKEHLILGINFILVLKVCLSSTTMAYYLARKDGNKRKDAYIIAIAVSYALSNYVVGYCWNLMWMDCILMFPLLMLGFERLMRDKDPKLYTLALFYCLYCNYYIGFMICIFLVIWFFVHSHGGIKKFFMDGIRFAAFSLIGGGLAMFSLIPAYFGIMATAAGDMKLPKWKWYGDIFDILKQHLFLTETITNQTFDGGANLYCGVFAIFAFFLYIFHINKKSFEKVKKILVLILLLASCNNELLNYIWHGFHNQYGIPNRFTFLYVFILLDIGYEVLCEIKNTRTYEVAFATVWSCVFIILCRVQINTVSIYAVICSVILASIYGVWIMLRTKKKMNKKIFTWVFTFVCCIEIIVNATFGFLENGYATLDGKYDTTQAIAEAYDEIKNMAAEDCAGFYRVELMDSTVLDEVTWHNLPSVGTFCSTVLGDMVTTMGRLGFYTGANEFLYMGYTPFTNSIFNVRYLLEREGDYNNYDYNYIGDVEGIGIYENPYPLSIGFCVNEKVLNWDRDTWRYENAQENLSFSMVGYSNFFDTVKPDLIVESNEGKLLLTQNKAEFTPYASGSAGFTTSFYVDEPGDYYLNARGSGLTKIRFYVNGEELTYDRYQSQIFHMGNLEKNDYVTVEYYYSSVEKDKQYNVTLTASIFDETEYQIVYNLLDDNMLEVSESADGYIRGEVDALSGQVLFTSIPYDEGWSIKVDGQEIKYKKVCDSFIAVPLEEGHHTVEMVYMPKGLMTGILISVISCLLFTCAVMAGNRKKHMAATEENSNNDIDREVNI